MARFTIATTAAAPFDHEMEALAKLDVQFVPVDAADEAAVLAAVATADAFYPTGKVTARTIAAMKNCKIIALGSIGVDYVDIAAATAAGIPVTNVPDTFVEEVADHAMTYGGRRWASSASAMSPAPSPCARSRSGWGCWRTTRMSRNWPCCRWAWNRRG